MKTTDFTNHDEVLGIVRGLQASRLQHPEDFIFSDVIDEEGHQYVDLVQEGGGMLGIALVGYTYVLEQMGIRFVSLAGTSAGDRLLRTKLYFQQWPVCITKNHKR